jgi:cytoskeletal protein CcmA (bactofilin family)
MRPFLLCALLLSVAGFSTAQTERGDRPSVLRSPSGNAYMAGGNLTIGQATARDLIAGGGRISVEGEVGADAALAGGTVDIRSPVAEDLRVVGGTVNIQSDVGADLVAAAGSLTVTQAARIGGPAWLAGGNVTMAGSVGNGARIYGNTVTIAGRIVGNTLLAGQQITLTPTARIEGNLSYASPTAIPADQHTQVSGTVMRLETPEGWRAPRTEMPGWRWFRPVGFFSMLFSGMLLYALFPNAVLGTERAIAQYPLRSLLAGFALLFAVPPVAVLFMLTLIGLPVGLTLLLLYPLALVLGYFGAAFFLSRAIAIALKKDVDAPSWKRKLVFLALALLLLMLVMWIPFAGFVVLAFAVIFGMGGWGVWAHLSYTTRANRRGETTTAG